MSTYRTNPRAVTMYRSDDGALWDTDDKAVARNAEIVACERALAGLKPRRGGSFKGYIQQDQAAVLAAKTTLLKVADVDGYLSRHWDISDPTKVATHGIMWRVIGEIDGPVSKAWGRLCCIDDDGREWEQPYFALNPGTGENVCIG